MLRGNQKKREEDIEIGGFGAGKRIRNGGDKVGFRLPPRGLNLRLDFQSAVRSSKVF